MRLLTRNKKMIFIGLSIIIINNLLGYFISPLTSFTQLILMPFIIAAINYRFYSRNFTKAILYNYALLLFNDLLSRWGGCADDPSCHDDESKGYVALFFFATFGLSFITMLILGWDQGGASERLKFLGLIFLAGIATLAIYTALYHNTQLLPF